MINLTSKRKRLARLETWLARQPGNGRPCHLLFLDLCGRILWDGSGSMREWSGRPVDDWPQEWLDNPWPIKLVKGIDPLVVLARDPERTDSSEPPSSTEALEFLTPRAANASGTQTTRSKETGP